MGSRANPVTGSFASCATPAAGKSGAKKSARHGEAMTRWIRLKQRYSSHFEFDAAGPETAHKNRVNHQRTAWTGSQAGPRD